MRYFLRVILPADRAARRLFGLNLSAVADGWPLPPETPVISGKFCGHSSHSADCKIATLRIMVKIPKPIFLAGIGCILGLMLGSAMAAVPEWNPVRSHPVEIGPQASRLIVGFRTTSDNAVMKMVQRHSRAEPIKITQAQTSEADVLTLVQRTGIAMAGSRQITPSMHVLFLPKTLYGADVAATLQQLRADPFVVFADVDQRRYAHALPNDPLFPPTPNAAMPAGGQWYMNTPSAAMILVDGVPTQDISATDAVSAWAITQGSTSTVIADVDTGIRFDHPDLLRAGFGGRLLPGYDFVDQDFNVTNGAALGTFLVANDGDGWDPDPSDPGDWISTTDQMNTALFPAANCPAQNSSWHGTRVVGVMGAITNNNVGIAGMTWNPYILPVRALGKCGGYDSDIIVGMQWAAGMAVMGVPNNPYPADIINLSLGGTGACTSAYKTAISPLITMGVLIVASAGNASGPVDAPGNCPGVLAVAGLRNVGTAVGYSSVGPEVGISAPAGNCVNSVAPCLRSIDTTINTGLTTPGTSTYSNQTNVNLGTSFSSPIVAGVAALMRAVNANLTPAQLIARIKLGASPFPANTGNLPVCPTRDATTQQCSCLGSGQCGAGMVNALSAVQEAQRPIVAVAIPAGFTTGSTTLNASGSAAACGATIASYAWTLPTGTVQINSGANAAQANITTSGSGQGTLTLTVTDSLGKTDTTILTFTSGGATSTAPSSAATSAGACPPLMNVTPMAPVITQAFSPASVAPNAAATLTLTLSNSNGFVLTQSGLTQTLPASLTIQTMPAPATTCTGASMSLTSTTSSVTLAGANIPANGSCTITMSVMSSTAGTYTNMIAANALTTGPAGGNAAAASASLDVTAPAGGGKSGGGGLDWPDMLLITGVLLAGRRYGRGRPRP
jgi:serine protease